MQESQVKEILSISIDNLREKQHEVLREFTIKKLSHVTSLIKGQKYEEAMNHLQISPGSDDMSCENYYISFEGLRSGIEDIHDVQEELIKLRGNKSRRKIE